MGLRRGACWCGGTHEVGVMQEVGWGWSEDYGFAGLVEGKPAGICYALFVDI